MGNKYSHAYFKCPKCGSLDKKRHRTASKNQAPKHSYKCQKCGAVAVAGKLLKEKTDATT